MKQTRVKEKNYRYPFCSSKTSHAELIHKSTLFAVLDESAQDILTEKDVRTYNPHDQFVSK